jgi:arylsulfatase A
MFRPMFAFSLLLAVAGISSAAQPNILFILTDDQGWPTLGCYGGKHVPTPYLDKLAKDGVRFTSAYVTPQCTPTRAALLTGQHPARSGMWHVIPWYGTPWAPVQEPAFREQLGRDTDTVAKRLKDSGYRTACLGKWHLTTNADGDYGGLKAAAAKSYGFDEVHAPPTGQKPGDKDVAHLTEEAIAFIGRNKAKPWFCYLAHHTVHGPVAAPADLVEKYRKAGAPADGLHNATYLAALEHLDTSVGRLLAALDEHKLRENTMVVFLSDNGGVNYAYDIAPYKGGPGTATTLTVAKREYDCAPLRGTKGTLYEGGVRVPCLVRWPGVAKAGSLCETPVQATDWFPTLLDAAGANVPAKELPADGTTIRPLIEGRTIEERAVYWYAPLYDLRWGATPAAAVRHGKFKIIEFFGDSFGPDGKYRPGRRTELYDLEADPAEAKDIAAERPETVKELGGNLRKFLEAAGATIPGANPNHDSEHPFRETNIKPK